MWSFLDRLLERLTHRRAIESQFNDLNTKLAEIHQLHSEREDVLTTADSSLQQQMSEVVNQLRSCCTALITLKQQREDDMRFAILEKNHTELFQRVQEAVDRLEALETESPNGGRLDILEKDRTELFQRVQETIDRLEALETDNSNGGRLDMLERDRTELFRRFDQIWSIMRACGLLNINSRLDSRIIRLELLWYYRNASRRECLDSEALALLEELENNYQYERDGGRTYPEDPHYSPSIILPLPYPLEEVDGMWYALIDQKKLFLGENCNDAEAYLRETLFWLEGDTPHRYLEPAQDGVEIPEGSILLDIGAAEGFFGIRHIEKCKKVYFFEYDEKWLKFLRKTCAPFGDKVEIIEGYVGEREQDIRLDDFFQNREKPTVIKMDVEGAEGAILRGMAKLIENNNPLTILLCTYHREEDWSRYYELLHDRFNITSSRGYYWNIQDPYPPFFRKGIMRAVKKKKYTSKDKRADRYDSDS